MELRAKRSIRDFNDFQVSSSRSFAVLARLAEMYPRNRLSHNVVTGPLR